MPSGRTFLDAGCGSGLFSLAALRLGAQRVHSFDYDPASVGCALELRRRYGGEDPRWTVERGDVLDEAYLAGLGTYDVVYSWGVLHHTGDMWRALRSVDRLVGPGGRLFIAIYNDQRSASRYWILVKRVFNRCRRPASPLRGRGDGAARTGVTRAPHPARSPPGLPLLMGPDTRRPGA